MLTIYSYIKTAGGSFVRIEECKDRLKDPDYVEGAIEISVDGVEIVGLAEWDYVDQLWSYLAEMLERFQVEGAASTYYPDQPIKLEFLRQKSRVLISATAGDQVRRASVAAAEFQGVFKDAGLIFFEGIDRLVPGNSDAYAMARAKLGLR